MTTYRSIDPVITLNAGAMSGNSTLHSSSLDILHLTNAAFEFSWTGTPVGSFQVEVSLTGNTWSSIDIPIQDAAGTADSRVINISGLAVRYIRLTYTNASGSGLLTVYASARGI